MHYINVIFLVVVNKKSPVASRAYYEYQIQARKPFQMIVAKFVRHGQQYFLYLEVFFCFFSVTSPFQLPVNAEMPSKHRTQPPNS